MEVTACQELHETPRTPPLGRPQPPESHFFHICKTTYEPATRPRAGSPHGLRRTLAQKDAPLPTVGGPHGPRRVRAGAAPRRGGSPARRGGAPGRPSGAHLSAAVAVALAGPGGDRGGQGLAGGEPRSGARSDREPGEGDDRVSDPRAPSP